MISTKAVAVLNELIEQTEWNIESLEIDIADPESTPEDQTSYLILKHLLESHLSTLREGKGRV